MEEGQQENNPENNSGNSIQVTYYERQEENEFFKPNLEPFKRPKFISPNITPMLVENIQQNRLLLIGGTSGLDKSALIRHLAARLSDMQHDTSDSNESVIDILEWNRTSSDQQNIEIKLLEIIKPTIFILPRISPQDVRYDLSSIKKAADRNQHFVIISTDIPYPGWKLPKDVQHFWQELPVDLYSSTDLANILIRELVDAHDSLPKGVKNSLDPDKPLIDGQLIRELAEELKTPENISRFVTLLCAEKKPLDQTLIKELINDSIDKRRTLERWYPALSSREQMIALGLSFFEGLYDDQFFAAMDRVVENAWQKRDSSLYALDYCDLDKLQDFFDLIPADNYGIKIYSRIPEQRRMLFEVAWNSHRRQILKTLPILAKLAADSVSDRSHDPELYGTLARREQLRIIISEAISDIGIISIDSVQRALWILAADNNLGVQAVAARAMARWRQYKKEEELFKMLEDWSRSPRDYIRATVSLVVSYAARYDSPNNLDNNLVVLLKSLAKDQSSLVRNRFCNHTLPNVVQRHLIQLREILHDMTQYTDLIPEVAKSLALAYRYSDREVIEMLQTWHQECRSLKSAYKSSTEISLRDKLLATIALTYGYIKYDKVNSSFTADEAFKRMQSILAEEKSPFVRKNVVIAIGLQSSGNFEKIEPLLQKLVVDVVESEGNEIVQILREIYLTQRRELKGSYSFLEIDGTSYPIWIDSERPQTVVERAMLRWIKDPAIPAAQQIAVRTLIEFADTFDQKESQRILEIRAQQTQSIGIRQSKAIDLSSPVELVKENRSIEKLAIWVVTLSSASSAHYNAIIQGLLPEILAQQKLNKNAMAFIIEKWHQAADEEIKTIAKLQKYAIWLIDHIALILGVAVLGMVALLLIGTMPNLLLILILLCALALIWFKTHARLGQKQIGIETHSLMQNASRIWDSFHR